MYGDQLGEFVCIYSGPYIAGRWRGHVFFSNIVSDFAGLFLVAILVRNLTKTEFAPADKKS